MSLPRALLVSLTLGLGLAPARAALANGRMPGANDVLFNAGDPQQLITRATFGIVQSFDRGASWQWICEQVIDVSGVVADPPLAVMSDGTQVLLPPTGSALVSMDHGCSWQRALEPLAGNRGVDLTLDANDPKRVLLLMSTLAEVDAQGFGSYRNLVIESLDDGHSWHTMATLPDDLIAETLEVAASDSQRIYVSGTDRKNSRLGIIERSEDGGQSWQRTTLALPAGTGSLLISAIAPNDPDRLWVRVPASGDTLGLLPASLMVSDDKGATFRLLASTQKAMFGLAVSPDGSRLAYGGPTDGLFVGPSDGSGPFEKRADLGVRCLRWTSAGELYVCGSEPQDAFSLGVSLDEGQTFRALFRLAETCPASCAADSSFDEICGNAWGMTRPFIRASGAMCSVPWAAPVMDAGAASDAGNGLLDAGGTPSPDAGEAEPEPKSGAEGCSCRLAPSERPGVAAWALSAWLGLALRARRRARVGRRGGQA
ncbi:MAG: hypothetical protein QM778_25325 [Myxococcales bacterium]